MSGAYHQRLRVWLTGGRIFQKAAHSVPRRPPPSSRQHLLRDRQCATEAGKQQHHGSLRLAFPCAMGHTRATGREWSWSAKRENDPIAVCGPSACASHYQRFPPPCRPQIRRSPWLWGRPSALPTRGRATTCGRIIASRPSHRCHRPVQPGQQR